MSRDKLTRLTGTVLAAAGMVFFSPSSAEAQTKRAPPANRPVASDTIARVTPNAGTGAAPIPETEPEIQENDASGNPLKGDGMAMRRSTDNHICVNIPVNIPDEDVARIKKVLSSMQAKGPYTYEVLRVTPGVPLKLKNREVAKDYDPEKTMYAYYNKFPVGAINLPEVLINNDADLTLYINTYINAAVDNYNKANNRQTDIARTPGL